MDDAPTSLLAPDEQINEGAAEPVDRPTQYDIEVPPVGIVEHPVQAWSVSPSLAAADAGVVVNLDHLPPAALYDLAQLQFLVLHGLLVGRYPQIERGAACHSLIPLSW